MSGKRLLMLINFFPPAAGGGVYRPLSFVKYLSRLSWHITVVTPEPGEFWISDPSLGNQIPPDVRIVRTRSLSGLRMLNRFRTGAGETSRRSSGRFELLRRAAEYLVVPDTYRGWVPFAYRSAARLCMAEHFDALYSTSPPDSTHLAAYRLARRFSLPWVADCRDPWISLYLRRPPTPLHRWLHERLERRLARADRVLVTTTWHERVLKEKFPVCRVLRILNGYDEEDFADWDDIMPPAHPFTILHCGMLTLGRSSKPFLEGLVRLFDESPELRDEVQVTFLGARESGNEQWVSRLGLSSSVRFEDNIPHDACIRRERSSHVLLLLKHDDPRYRGLVPGKLYEYLGARRPIFAVAPEGEAAETVRELRRGEVAGIGDARGVAEAVRKLYELHRTGTLEQAYALEPLPAYTRRVEAEQLDGILESLREG
jgi:glycosyltransferase involved in cell wall biosynthesis